MTETWKRLWRESRGQWRELVKEGDEEKLLPILRTVFGPDATLETYREFHRRWAQLKEQGERWAELIVVYGLEVINLPVPQQEALRLALPYARGCLAVAAAESAAASNARGVPSIETFRALTGRDDREAQRLLHERIANISVR